MAHTPNEPALKPYMPRSLDSDPDDSMPAISPPPGQQAVVLAALFIGLLLLGIQLWLLTVALDRYLSGAGQDIWVLPVLSGLIFCGGLLALRFLRQHRPLP